MSIRVGKKASRFLKSQHSSVLLNEYSVDSIFSSSDDPSQSLRSRRFKRVGIGKMVGKSRVMHSIWPYLDIASAVIEDLESRVRNLANHYDNLIRVENTKENHHDRIGNISIGWSITFSI